MPILGDATVVIARVARSTSNALRVQLTTLNAGSKTDGAWHHRLVSPTGAELGVLTLVTVNHGWNGIAAETTQWILSQQVGALKVPSAGVLLELRAPVAPEVGDVLAAACVDFSVLPRGYIA
jgi:hypothetical protein